MKFGLRETIFLLVLLAVPVASGFYVFKPQNERVHKLKQEIQAKRARLEQLDQMQQKIDDIGLAIERGREAIEVIESKLPGEQDVEGILEQVWQIAKRNNLTVKSIKSQKAVPASMYMELPLDVAMEGQFDGYYQFLLDLEALPRITRVHTMTLERLDVMDKRKNDEPLPPGSMRAEFTLSIYFEPRAH